MTIPWEWSSPNLSKFEVSIPLRGSGVNTSSIVIFREWSSPKTSTHFTTEPKSEFFVPQLLEKIKTTEILFPAHKLIWKENGSGAFFYVYLPFIRADRPDSELKKVYHQIIISLPSNVTINIEISEFFSGKNSFFLKKNVIFFQKG